jgi:hypothetical protein
MGLTKIKPCPFGGESIIDTDEGWAYCSKCHTKARSRLWNTRAPITREQVNEWCLKNGFALIECIKTEDLAEYLRKEQGRS